MIDYGKFQLSLKRLEEQHHNHQHGGPDRSELDLEGVAESVIRRFETCYDCIWKVLKRYLAEDLGVPEVPNSPKPIFRIAHENHLFTASLDRWLSYADARIGTSHDYDGEKARSCLRLVPGFMDDAVALYQTMSGLQWE